MYDPSINNANLLNDVSTTRINIGFLRVEVTTGHQAIPINNADVIVMANDDNGIKLLDVLQTNITSRTDTVALETKPKDLSLVPGFKEPFSVCDVEINANGFYRMLCRDVQIFENIVTVLPVSMIPKTFVSNVSVIELQTNTQDL